MKCLRIEKLKTSHLLTHIPIVPAASECLTLTLHIQFQSLPALEKDRDYQILRILVRTVTCPLVGAAAKELAQSCKGRLARRAVE